MKTVKELVAEPKINLDKGSALMVIAIAASRADGALHPEELACLRMLAYNSPLYAAIESVDRYIERCAEFVRDTGTEDAAARAIAELSPRLRETAYAWAVEVVCSDRKLKQPEHAFLQALRAKLGIDGHLAGKIKAAAAIRNRAA